MTFNTKLRQRRGGTKGGEVDNQRELEAGKVKGFKNVA
jgi:hypothetical protein